MLNGLLQLHIGLAYVLFLVSLLNLACALAPSGLRASVSDAGETQASALATLLRVAHQLVLIAGRFMLCLGVGVLFAQFDGQTSFFSNFGWFLLSILLWFPVELAGRHRVKPEIDYICDGGQPTRRLLIGTATQLLFVASIFGIMHAR